jgi:hypothetical protein
VTSLTDKVGAAAVQITTGVPKTHLPPRVAREQDVALAVTAATAVTDTTVTGTIRLFHGNGSDQPLWDTSNLTTKLLLSKSAINRRSTTMSTASST